ncbi:hypothetical protein EYC84_000700 [Monilinia fructicola]|uniref:Uncharacterized protein n=1 Tax=Monilinia fructicola TaxID=38448 RepID=A0A5M9JJW6_MONFR|nr:hypothetical protein EYC84_000700 [Monilinia fructicola]
MGGSQVNLEEYLVAIVSPLHPKPNIQQRGNREEILKKTNLCPPIQYTERDPRSDFSRLYDLSRSHSSKPWKRRSGWVRGVVMFILMFCPVILPCPGIGIRGVVLN